MRRLPPRMIIDDHPCYRRRRQPHWGLRLGTLLLAATLLVIGWQSARAQNLDDVGAGQLLFSDGDSPSYQPAVLVESAVQFQVSGLINRVQLKQTFRNDGAVWREAIYAFPLPEQAAVRALRIWIGERLIEGEIRERQQAQQIYRQAKAEGKRAGLVEQQRPNLFTTAVANIGPGETVVVELEYVDAVRYDSGTFSLRFPMTITPRYIPGTPLAQNAESEQALEVAAESGWARPTDQVADADRITPFLNPALPAEGELINPITISAEIDAGLPLEGIDSRYHRIALRRQGERYQVELAAGRVSMNRDFELHWRTPPGREPTAALFTETVGGEHYALLMLLPPQLGENLDPAPREIIYVVDTSGSMGGTSIVQARASLLLALRRLRPQDRFNVIEFNSVANPLYREAQVATPERVAQAQRFVAGLQATGGTEMLPALQLALHTPPDEAFLRQVVFITDGAVGNEAALFALIRERLGGARLFTVGIGSAPNAHFMRKAAQFGRGSFTYVGAVDEVQEKMSALFEKLESPLVTDLQVQWPQGTGALQFPAPLPDLYRGEPLLVSAKLADLRGTIAIGGRSGGKTWHRQLALKSGAADRTGAASRWARLKIEQLLDEKIAGRDESAVRADVLAVALPHRLVSPYTSFVAAEQAVSRPQGAALQKASVASARPLGQSPQPFAYPATATDGIGRLILGIGLLLLVWAMRRATRKESEYGIDQRS